MRKIQIETPAAGTLSASSETQVETEKIITVSFET
jgi:hypothetical protein